MSNTNAPFGFRPVRRIGGGEIAMTEYTIASGYTVSLFTGDAVMMSGTSNNIKQAPATTTNAIGIFAGCVWTDSTGIHWSPYWPASQTSTTTVKAYVYDDPMLVMWAQADATTTAEIGVQVDYTVGSGSTATGLSASYAVVSGKTDVSGKPFKVMRLAPKPGNTTGSYAIVELTWASHSMLVGGPGVS